MSRFFPHFIRPITITALTAGLLTACMVGPNFHQPTAPCTKCYTQWPLPKKTVSIPKAGYAGVSQQYINCADIPAQWWYLFHSPVINCLVATGLANSPTIIAAQAALRAAQEALNVQIGNSFAPAINAVGIASRQNAITTGIGSSTSSLGTSAGTSTTSTISGVSAPQEEVFNVFNASVNVSYAPDVFGGARRQIEALAAQVDYQQFQLLASYLTLTSNIVTTAITIASLDQQIKATIRLIQEQEDQLDIIQKQFKLGGVSNINVLTQLTLVEQTKATLPPLQKSLAQSLHAMSALVGAYPCQPLPEINLDCLVLPKDIPVSLPACMVRQRPDIRASEALLHAASAQIGVATANMLPQFNLTANYGRTGATIPDLFNPENVAWSLMAQITQPIFHGGALIAARKQTIALYQQSGAQYCQTVLQAFQNVADSLRAIETDARTFEAQDAAQNAAFNNLVITQQQFRLGGVNYLNVLTAQEQYQQTVISRIQAQAQRYSDTVALFQSLGGGWWNRCPIPVCGKDSVNPTAATLACPR